MHVISYNLTMLAVWDFFAQIKVEFSYCHMKMVIFACGCLVSHLRINIGFYLLIEYIF